MDSRTLDRVLAGPDLSHAVRPDPRRLAGVHRRAIVAAVLQAVYPVFAVVTIGGSYLGILDPQNPVVAAGEFGASLPGLVAFLYWFAGAYRLAEDFSPAPLATTPGWAVAQFFIPIVSLFMPYQRMREIEEASAARGELLDEPRSSQILVLWWTAWVLSAVASGVMVGVETAGGVGTTMAAFGLLAVATAIASNVTAALVALHVDAGQQALADAIDAAQPLAPEAFTSRSLL